MTDIHPEIARVAFSLVEGSDFERFVNAFYPSLAGIDFQPLGSRHDGGADGFGGDPVHERTGRTTHFYQASVQQDTKAAEAHRGVSSAALFSINLPRYLTLWTADRVRPHLQGCQIAWSEDDREFGNSHRRTGRRW